MPKVSKQQSKMFDRAEQRFKSSTVTFAVDIYKGSMNRTEPAMQLLKRCLDNVGAIGPETLREVAMNAAEGVYAVELDELCTKLLAAA